MALDSKTETRCLETPGVYITPHREEGAHGEFVQRFLSVDQTDNLSLWRESLSDSRCHVSFR